MFILLNRNNLFVEKYFMTMTNYVSLLLKLTRLLYALRHFYYNRKYISCENSKNSSEVCRERT